MAIEDAERFHKRLMEYIEKHGLTDKDIAHEIGVSRPTVKGWKEKKFAPHPAMMPAVWRHLDKLAINTRDAFYERLLGYVEKHGLTDSDIAHAVDVSLPCVRRWRENTAAPHPAVMPCVFERLDELANNTGSSNG